MILLQVDMTASLIGEIAKVGGVPAVLSLCICWLIKENRRLVAENTALQNELKKELKNTTSFVKSMHESIETFKK